jgi:hypothetical protein
METLSMEVVDAHCAGIDVGSRFHMVAVDQNPEQVRKFQVYSPDHQQLIGYLQQHQLSPGKYGQLLAKPF